MLSGPGDFLFFRGHSSFSISSLDRGMSSLTTNIGSESVVVPLYSAPLVFQPCRGGGLERLNDPSGHAGGSLATGRVPKPDGPKRKDQTKRYALVLQIGA